jgi:hypothetical protein
MKNLFKHFTWSKFFAYAIVFGIISVLFDWVLGKFKEVDFVLYKYLLGVLLKTSLFGFFMALINTPKKEKN